MVAMLGTIATWALAFIFLAYAIPHLVVAWFYKTKNLKKAYNAEWALVTGASSGEAIALREAPPPPSPCRRRRRRLPPPCTLLHAPYPGPLPCPTQASASRLRASWRGRG